MHPRQKVLGGRSTVKVAVVQTPPVYMDVLQTLECACAKIAEAGAQDAELIVFSEAWLAGYPYWGQGWESKLGEWMQARVRFYDSAVLVPSEATEALGQAAAHANAYLVIGCNEIDSRPSVHTIYNTLLFFDPSGKLFGSHRKCMPTFTERAVWGSGDGTDLVTYPTDIGRLGGLICGEHLMTLVRARMIEQGEDFHIAVFPGAFALHSGPKLEEADTSGQFFWGHSSTRAHALEAGAFVLSACGYMRREDFPPDFPLMDTVNADYAHGGSQIVAPLGIPLVPPTSGDTILYADCHADMIKVWKAVIDTLGHYSRPDIVRLEYLPQVAATAVQRLARAQMEEVADRHEVSPKDVENAVARIAKYGRNQ